jgi:broad specificity phosphatase PhoE
MPAESIRNVQPVDEFDLATAVLPDDDVLDREFMGSFVPRASARVDLDGPIRCREPLRNGYLLLRHELAHSNVEGVLASDPNTEACAAGLTNDGIARAMLLGQRIAELLAFGPDVHAERLNILCSPLPRAVQTAQIIVNQINADWAAFGAKPLSVIVMEELREREWGPEFEGRPAELWHQIQRGDRLNSPCPGVETQDELLTRIVSVFERLEQRSGSLNLVVTHCDCIQAAALVASFPVRANHYSDFSALENGKGVFLGSKHNWLIPHFGVPVLSKR